MVGLKNVISLFVWKLLILVALTNVITSFTCRGSMYCLIVMEITKCQKIIIIIIIIIVLFIYCI